jgi:hypothetical protein
MEINNFYLRIDKNNFDYNFGTAFHFNEGDEAIFKLVNLSVMNGMLNISSYHENNKFKIVDVGITTIYTIPDGNYSITTLKDTFNELTINSSIALNYEPLTNKFYISCADTGITFYPMNMNLILGFNKTSYSLIVGDNYANTFANLLSYTKIILVSNNLVFNPTTDNNLINQYSSKDGINEIICWVDKDQPTFTTIKYINLNNDEHKIANKNLTYINFILMNEYKEIIKDVPEYYVQFQIKIKKSLLLVE